MPADRCPSRLQCPGRPSRSKRAAALVAHAAMVGTVVGMHHETQSPTHTPGTEQPTSPAHPLASTDAVSETRSDAIEASAVSRSQDPGGGSAYASPSLANLIEQKMNEVDPLADVGVADGSADVTFAAVGVSA